MTGYMTSQKIWIK